MLERAIFFAQAKWATILVERLLIAHGEKKRAPDFSRFLFANQFVFAHDTLFAHKGWKLLGRREFDADVISLFETFSQTQERHECAGFLLLLRQKENLEYSP